MKQKYYFLSAVAVSMLMLFACTTDDGTADAVASTDQGSPLIVSVNPGDISASYTRAESNVQGTQFKASEYLDVFIRDASGFADSTQYASPVRYKTTNTNGTMSTYSYTYDNTSGRTYDESVVRPLYWPKLLHDMYIFGVYPIGSVGSSKTKTAPGSYDAFTATQDYWFSIQADQESEENYKKSDLMIGLPSSYTKSTYTAPFLLDQVEDPGNIRLTFTHRLTKIIVNVTTSQGTNDITENDHILYTGDGDTKYAKVTLMKTNRKTWFKIWGESAIDQVVSERAEDNGTIYVGRGKTTTSFTVSSVSYTALTLSAVIPPQQITSANPFIKVELIDGDNITDTFLYSTDQTFDATKVYTYNIRINKPNIIVTTTITNWVDGGTTNNIGIWQ